MLEAADPVVALLAEVVSPDIPRAERAELELVRLCEAGSGPAQRGMLGLCNLAYSNGQITLADFMIRALAVLKLAHRFGNMVEVFAQGGEPDFARSAHPFFIAELDAAADRGDQEAAAALVAASSVVSPEVLRTAEMLRRGGGHPVDWPSPLECAYIPSAPYSARWCDERAGLHLVRLIATTYDLDEGDVLQACASVPTEMAHLFNSPQGWAVIADAVASELLGPDRAPFKPTIN